MTVIASTGIDKNLTADMLSRRETQRRAENEKPRPRFGAAVSIFFSLLPFFFLFFVFLCVSLRLRVSVVKRLILLLVPVPQNLRRLLQHATLVARQARDTVFGDFVEHAVELFGLRFTA